MSPRPDWNNIEDGLQKRKEAAKQKEIKREREALISRRTKAAAAAIIRFDEGIMAPEYGLWPSPDEFTRIDTIVDLINQPEDDEIHCHTFRAPGPTIEDIVEKWRQPYLDSLLNIVHAGWGPDPTARPTEATVERLSLASTFFRCRNDHDLNLPCISYQGIRSHRCRKPTQPVQDPPNLTPPTPGLDLSCLIYSHTASVKADRLITAAGQDPAWTTDVDMDVLDLRFYCQDCPKGKNLARSWRNCVRSSSLSGFH